MRATEPVILQVFIGSSTPVTDTDAFERRLYITRKVVSGDVYEADRNGATKRSQNVFYCVSMSCRTVVYKGMFLANQLAAYYPDLADPDFISAPDCARRINASRRTLSRRGSSRIPIAWLPTTARSTRCAAT